MEVVNIEVKGNRQDLLSFLKGKVFHLTTRDAFQGILKGGVLLNNKDGKFKINPSSANSFGRLFGYVCFFDLRNKSDAEIEDILYKYNFITPRWFQQCHVDYSEWNLAYMILSPEHYTQLFPYEKATEHYAHSGKWLQVIPYAEAWIPDRIPIEWFSKVYIVHNEVHSPALRTLASALYDMELNYERKDR